MDSIETINYRLKRDYGYFDGTLNPNWRVIFSHDEIERRWVTHSDEGFELAQPIVIEVPKYRQYADNYYILERAIPIPENVETDLVGKWSYEPVWVFKDKNGNALAPLWSACRLIVDTVYKNSAGYVGAKYKDPFTELKDPKVAVEAKKERLSKLREELFGNETDAGDALAYGSGVVVPHGETTQLEKVKDNGITTVDGQQSSSD